MSHHRLIVTALMLGLASCAGGDPGGAAGACTGDGCTDAGIDPHTNDGGTDAEDEPCEGPRCDAPCEPTCRAGEECVEGTCVCIEGEARVCGLKLGICTYGEQICDRAVWGPCEGGIEPQPEVCDHVDNDCDGEADNGVRLMFFRDLDRDGFGDDDAPMEACEPGDGLAEVGGDCDDENAAINPGADEVCDGVDNNCSGLVDGEDPAQLPPLTECLTQGVCADTAPACHGDGGWACLYADAYEVGEETTCDGLDNDCDGDTDEGLTQTWWPDTDEDEWGADGEGAEACGAPSDTHVQRGGDCRDDLGAVNPDAVEICDELDNNCDGEVDEGCNCVDGQTVPCGSDVGECTRGVRTCVDGEYGECDGQGPVEEFCDPEFRDHDCDGLDDNQEGLTTPYYVDFDGDEFGAGPLMFRCGDREQGQAEGTGDCNDMDDGIFPGAPEVCDGVDQDCNRVIDDDPVPTQRQCLTDGVCLGTRPTCGGDRGWECIYAHPRYEEGAEESCDGIDNDCDAEEDEGVCFAPTAQCPADMSGNEGDTFTLVGSGSDPDGGRVTYQWSVTAAPPGSFARPTPDDAAQVSFVPDRGGSFELRFCVVDDEGEQTCCSMTIEAEALCVPPQAPRMTTCPVSWDRRPVVEFSPVPNGVTYDLFADDVQVATVDTPFQNFFRPDAPLSGGAAPPEGRALTYRIRACVTGQPECCAPEETATTAMIEGCNTPIAPSPSTISISEYLVNGDGGDCPGEQCEAGEGLEITNLSHCPVSLDGYHVRYCNNDRCSTHRYMNFGPADVVPPRGVYVVIRRPGDSVCEFPFFGPDDPSLFGLKVSNLEVQGNRSNNNGWFLNSGGGSLRVASGAFIDPDAGATVALVDPYIGNSADCDSVGFDAVNACGDFAPGAQPTTRLPGNQLGRLWHPCDAVVAPFPQSCR